MGFVFWVVFLGLKHGTKLVGLKLRERIVWVNIANLYYFDILYCVIKFNCFVNFTFIQCYLANKLINLLISFNYNLGYVVFSTKVFSFWGSSLSKCKKNPPFLY